MKNIKVTFYFDVYPGVDLTWVLATTRPTSKYEGIKRYAIDVEIPDPNEPDEVLGIVGKEIE